ncbi:MAG: hypothetical protein ACP5T4_00505 [Candidatus Micrarchaeia archaeon]
MHSNKSICIICGQEKPGIEIEEGYVIGAIRWFKRNVTKNEQGNKLVVCKDCYLKYASLRKRYENRMKTYFALGVIFLLFSVAISSNKLAAFALGLVVLFLLLALSLLSYVPKLKIPTKQSS